jgi:uncharacterized protein with GYD domain
MAKYLFQISYTEIGHKGILEEGGTSWQKTVETAIRKLDGWLEAFYFSFGETGIIVIADLPDHVSAATFSLIATSAGAARIKTTVLISPAEIDLAAKKTVSYHDPGTGGGSV